MPFKDLIPTIGEDDDVGPLSDSDDDELQAAECSITPDRATQAPIGKKRRKAANGDFNKNFEFEQTSESFFADKLAQIKSMAKQGTVANLDEKIARVREKRFGKTLEKEESQQPIEDELADNDLEDEKNIDIIKTKTAKKHKEIKREFFEDCNYDVSLTFEEMNFSRPVNKAVCAMNYAYPTPIQSACIPVCLMGKDICACAATGTGKTAAYMLPIVERLLFKPKFRATTRVLILVPTRELAIQVYEVGTKLAQFTSVTFGLSAGGLDIKSQEASLRMSPDVVIATPGRLIDHLHNSPSFSLANIEVLVLDEADRMLDEYFDLQMREIIRMCSPVRQTMLFSATMTDEVKNLAAVSLNKPVKLFINENTDLALNLKQEFVRIRERREGDREAIVISLIRRFFNDHVLLFVQTKTMCHRMHILLGLFGINAAEMHGNLSQAQRIEALQAFREARIDVLVTTDLAARGLDIDGVKTVINFTLPPTFRHYVHRVGRTARAGKAGRAVSLVLEGDRKLLKEIMKFSRTPVKQRLVNPEVVEQCRLKIDELQEDVEKIMAEQEEEKQLLVAEKQLKKAEVRLEKKPADKPQEPRTWFMSKNDQKIHDDALRRLGIKKHYTFGKNDRRIVDKKQRSNPEEERQAKKNMEYHARCAKRQRKPKRLRAFGDSLASGC